LLLTVDPSSTCTGYAVMGNAANIVDAGLLRAGSDKAPAVERIYCMRGELRNLIRQYQPACVLIEVTSGHTAGRIHRRTAGLAVYGMAVGALLDTAWAEARCVEYVEENAWTAGVPKEKRQARIAAIFPEYAQAKQRDVGADVADAIGLALWWYERKHAKERMQA
jgi:Holliday junction resolvasome RuvABC endonuclease subunit